MAHMWKQSQRLTLEGVTFNCDSLARRAVVVQHQRANYTRVQTRSYLVGGFVFDQNYGSPATQGNINLAVLTDCMANAFVRTKRAQKIRVEANGGTLTLTYAGQTTGAIAWDATPATVQAALEALSTIGAGNIVVEEAAPPTTNVGLNTWIATFQGTFVGSDPDLMTGNASGLTLTTGDPPVTVAGTLNVSAAQRGYYAVSIAPGGATNNGNGHLFIQCRATNNASHGMLLKGHRHIVQGGNYFNNGGYGVQVGEGTVENRSQAAILYTPWLESNLANATLGGVNFQRQTQGIHWRNAAANIQGTTFTDAAGAMQIMPWTLGLGGALRIEAFSDNRTIDIGTTNVTLGGGSATDRDWIITPKGAGALRVDGSGGVRLGANGPRVIGGVGDPAVAIAVPDPNARAAVAAPVSSLFLRSDGGAGSAVYAKTSGSGSTGWTAIA